MALGEKGFPSIHPTDLFNQMSGFGSMVTLDSRSAEEYRAGHIPRSLNVPVTLEDIKNEVSLEDIAKRVARMEQRTFARRARQRVIIYGQDGTDGDTAAECVYLATLLKAEGKVRSTEIVSGGWSTFVSKFPFLSCSFKPKEEKSGRHAHLPPFPWFPNEILDDFLYLGNHVDAKNKKHMELLGISSVMNVSSDVENFHPDAFQYVNFVLPDEETADISKFFADAFAHLDQVHKASGRVLVHCHQGVSRSATVVFAYLIHTRGWTLKQTYDHVKSRRKQVFPNIGFWKQLALFEESVLGTSTLDQCVDMHLLQTELDNRKAGKDPTGGGGDAVEQEATTNGVIKPDTTETPVDPSETATAAVVDETTPTTEPASVAGPEPITAAGVSETDPTTQTIETSAELTSNPEPTVATEPTEPTEATATDTATENTPTTTPVEETAEKADGDGGHAQDAET